MLLTLSPKRRGLCPVIFLHSCFHQQWVEALTHALKVTAGHLVGIMLPLCLCFCRPNSSAEFWDSWTLKGSNGFIEKSTSFREFAFNLSGPLLPGIQAWPAERALAGLFAERGHAMISLFAL